MSLYQNLKAAGCKIDSHESDLYVEDSLIARALTKDEPNRSIFFNQVTHSPWIEIPFAFDPWWEKRQVTKKS